MLDTLIYSFFRAHVKYVYHVNNVEAFAETLVKEKSKLTVRTDSNG